MTRLGLTLALTLTPVVAAPQPLHVENGKLERHAATPSLESAFRALLAAQRSPAWLGYEVPASAGHGGCCYDSTRDIGPCPGCRLESMRSFSFRTPAAGRIDLEMPPGLVVLFRAEAGRVERLETLSPDCGIDLGGRTLHWIEGVSPAQSLGLLASLASVAERRDEVWDAALSAIALHAEAGADALLIRFARHDPRDDVRGQALFWLAQRAGDKAVAAIHEAIEQDPELEVKRQAVFALSELPDRSGVPLLIEIARTHRNPEVRREAFFWLGEAEDPRALAFFEEVLIGPRARR